MSVSSVHDKSLQLAESVARYHAGCLRVIGAQNVALRDVRTTKKAALCIDVGQLTEVEGVLSNGQQAIVAPEVPPDDAPEEEIAEYERCQVVWERLRELSAKAAVERHAKEVVYRGPLLIGYLDKARGRSMDPVLGLLFMQAVSLKTDSDGSVVVTSSDEPPRFNTVLWKDGIGSDDVAQIVNFGIEAQADLAAGWDPARVAELLKAIASVWPALEIGEPDRSLNSWPPMVAARERPEEPGLALHDGGVLFLADRSSPYLLADLESIAANPAGVVVPDRPLSILLEPPSTEDRPEARAPHVEEVVYPFPSNGAQRQVADALEKNNLVVVQGPSGNGKSLTIANLASHLVAQGTSVLVSSHKPQALTVVRDKLEESGQRFLFASLIGDGGAAKRVLQGQIADVKAFAAKADRTTLTRQLKEIEERCVAKGSRYRELRDRFIGSAEPDQEDAALRWEDFGGLPTLPVTDVPVDTAQQPLAAAALRRLDEIVRRHATVWARLRGAAIADLKSIEEQRQTLGQFVDQQTARVVAGTDPVVGALVAAFHPVVDALPSELSEARRASAEIRASLVAVLGASEQREAAESLEDSPDLLSDVEGGIDSLEAAFAQARDLAPHRDDVGAEPVRRGQVVAQHALLGSMLKRRAARRWLDEYAPGASGVPEEQVDKWAAFWGSWSRVRTIADGLAGGLRGEIPERFDPDAVQAVLSSSRRAIDRAKAIRAVREAAQTTRVPLPIADALEARVQGDLDDVVLRWERALAACEADQAGNALKKLDSLSFLEGDAVRVDDLLDQGAYAEAEEILDRLREIRSALPSFQERRGLLDGNLVNLPAAVEEVESCAEELDALPAWFSDIELSLAVHPSVVRFAEVASGRSTGDLAAELAGLVDDIVDDAGRYLGLRIQERILDGFRRPSFLSSLEGFRKAIGASAKRPGGRLHGRAPGHRPHLPAHGASGGLARRRPDPADRPDRGAGGDARDLRGLGGGYARLHRRLGAHRRSDAAERDAGRRNRRAEPELLPGGGRPGVPPAGRALQHRLPELRIGHLQRRQRRPSADGEQPRTRRDRDHELRDRRRVPHRLAQGRHPRRCRVGLGRARNRRPSAGTGPRAAAGTGTDPHAGATRSATVGTVPLVVRAAFCTGSDPAARLPGTAEVDGDDGQTRCLQGPPHRSPSRLAFSRPQAVPLLMPCDARRPRPVQRRLAGRRTPVLGDRHDLGGVGKLDAGLELPLLDSQEQPAVSGAPEPSVALPEPSLPRLSPPATAGAGLQVGRQLQESLAERCQAVQVLAGARKSSCLREGQAIGLPQGGEVVPGGRERHLRLPRVHGRGGLSCMAHEVEDAQPRRVREHGADRGGRVDLALSQQDCTQNRRSFRTGGGNIAAFGTVE